MNHGFSPIERLRNEAKRRGRRFKVSGSRFSKNAKRSQPSGGEREKGCRGERGRMRQAIFLPNEAITLGASVRGFGFNVMRILRNEPIPSLTPSPLPSDGRGAGRRSENYETKPTGRRWAKRDSRAGERPCEKLRNEANREKERKGAREKGGKGAVHVHPAILPNEAMRWARRFRVSGSRFKVVV